MSLSRVNRNDKGFAEALGIIVIAVVALIAVVVVAMVLTGTRPWFLEREREAVQNSRQYVETRGEVLNNYTREVRKLETEISDIEANNPGNTKGIETRKAQIQSLLNNIEQEAGTIDRSEIPRPVVELMREYGRNI